MISDTWATFWGRVDMLHPSGCWPISGAVNGSGYAYTRIGKLHMASHVASVLYSGRSIPGGMEVDHLCKNRRCVKPSHLEVVTHIENVRRIVRTSCARGHEFTGENTRVDKRGRRTCRTCNRMAQAAYQAKKKKLLAEQAA